MKHLALTAMLLILLCTPAHSAELAGVTLPETQMVSSTQLTINGMALRQKFIFDVYVAGLYLTEKSSDPETILTEDTARIMIMHFLRDVGADKINDAWYEGLEDNVSPVSPKLKAKFDQLANMMENIKDGEVMTFTYEPDTGTTVIVNGQNKGVIQGKDFADAILATWIGPKPGPGKKFKAALLDSK